VQRDDVGALLDDGPLTADEVERASASASAASQAALVAVSTVTASTFPARENMDSMYDMVAAFLP
jgi:hypothetical protein